MVPILQVISWRCDFYQSFRLVFGSPYRRYCHWLKILRLPSGSIHDFRGSVMLSLFFVLATIGGVAADCVPRKCRNELRTAPCGDCCLSEVPQNLSPRVQVLDLSDNKIENLRSDSFAFYPNLQILHLQWNHIKSVAVDVFSHQTDLKILNLDHNYMTELPVLPSSLTHLNLSCNSRLSFETNAAKFSNLRSLEVLHMRQINLNTFPKLAAVGVSLTELDVQENPDLVNFTVPDLAPLCRLKKLFIGIDKAQNATFSMTADVCACRDVLEWMHKYAIEGTGILCPNNQHIKCEKTDLSDAESVRTKCLWISRVNFPRKYWIIGGIILLLVICSCIYCCIRCRRRKLSQNKTTCCSTTCSLLFS